MTVPPHLDRALQPIYDLHRKTIDHFEVLARFAAADTQQTILNLEQRGLIVGHDVAMLDWAIHALTLDPTICLNVNVSGASVASPDIHRLLERRDCGARGRLILEVTETAPIGDERAYAAFVAMAHRQGYFVALDDYGASDSHHTLSMLLEVPPDYLKLDGAYFRAASRELSPDLLALMDMARTMGVHTIAEKIESAGDLAYAWRLGVDMAQGYYFGAPLSAESLATPRLAAGLITPLNHGESNNHGGNNHGGNQIISKA